MARPAEARLRLSPEGRRRLAEEGRYAAQALAQAQPEAGSEWASLTLPIENLDQAARLVLSLAPQSQALFPPELRERVAELAKGLARQHSGRI